MLDGVSSLSLPYRLQSEAVMVMMIMMMVPGGDDDDHDNDDHGAGGVELVCDEIESGQTRHPRLALESELGFFQFPAKMQSMASNSKSAMFPIISARRAA